MRTVALPQDSAGFVRRSCPFCERSFKTRPFPTDGLAVQRQLSRTFHHENPHEIDASALRACVYCGRMAPPEEWLTAEQRAFLDQLANGLVQEVRFDQLSHVARTLAQNPRPTFVLLPPRRPPGAMPPEPDDLRPVPLLCCGEEAKIVDDWQRSLFCPRCGTKQATTTRHRLTFDVVPE